MTTLAKKKKVLILAPQPFYQNRGTPIAVKLLAEELALGGFDVHLLVFHEGEQIEMDGVTLHRIPSLGFIKNIPPSISLKKIVCDVFMFFSMMKLIRQHRFDLLHAVEESAFMAMVARVVFKTPYIYDMDSSLAIQIVDKLHFMKPCRSILEFFEKKAVSSSTGVVAVCKALEDIAHKYAPQCPIVRLEDITLLDSSIKNSENLRDTIPNNTPIILYVGNLEGYQGIDLLLHSFTLLKQEGCSGNLVIIGGSDKHILQYNTLAEQLGISQHTHFIGSRPVEYLGHYLSQADILVSPRIQGNNTPMKLYSYLDSGKPVVATNLPTHTQALSPDCSILVEPDETSMAEGLKSLIENPDLGHAIGNKGKALAQSQYSREAFTKKLLSFYQNVFSSIRS